MTGSPWQPAESRQNEALLASGGGLPQSIGQGAQDSGMTIIEDHVGEESRQNEQPLADGGERSVSSAPAPGTSRPLDFDVVIATRNRPEALALSIPLVLGQSRQPRKLIVIDSSDDHARVAETVAEAVDKARAGPGWSGKVVVEHSGRGAAYQRNRGLAHVEAEVVFFPDDDSLFHPGTSEAIMRAYELDTDGRIAGVCAADALDPPAGALAGARYQMTRVHKQESRALRLRNRLERRFDALSPTHYLGGLLKARFEPLDWFEAENCVLVEYMTGYRMSFRTAVIRANPFDETLRFFGLVEDPEASFAAMRHGALVGARNARIYHHKFPGGRGDPFWLGLVGVLNRSYVVLKHVHDAGLAPAEAERVRRVLRRFGRLKVLSCLTRLHRGSGRDELRGTLAALDGVKVMLDTPRADLPRVFTEIHERIQARRSGAKS
jgi:glycosyltransferase involved in cell wall biosynthesis